MPHPLPQAVRARPHSTMATAPTTKGTATMSPVCSRVKSVWNCSEKPATIEGRKKLRAFRP